MFVKEERDNYLILNWLDEFMIGHKGFICGGCFKNIFNKEDVKDLDIFFENGKDYDDAIQFFDSMTTGYEGRGKGNDDYSFYYENDNVKAYKHNRTGIVIELCNKIFGTPEQVLERFDFTITKFAYYKEEVRDLEKEEVISESDETDKDKKVSTHIEYKVIFHDKFFEHLHTKRLVTDNEIPFPMSTLERMFRYAKYGYFPCRETKMKIVSALRELNDEQVKLSESLYDGMD